MTRGSHLGMNLMELLGRADARAAARAAAEIRKFGIGSGLGVWLVLELGTSASTSVGA